MKREMIAYPGGEVSASGLHRPLPPPTPPAEEAAPAAAPAAARRVEGRGRLWRAVMWCAVLALLLCGVLWPALRTAYVTLAGRLTLSGVSEAIGQVLLQGGLPPTDRLPLEGWGWLAEETSTEPESEVDTYREVTTTPPEPPEGESTRPAATTEAVSDSLQSPTEEVTTPASPEGESESEPPADTTVDVPAGCVPIRSLDMSCKDLGVGYLTGSVDQRPHSLPTGRPWRGEGEPIVLVVNTHPYEGYGSGAPWYDPAREALAVVDAPSDPDGTVALAAALTRSLRAAGVTVMQVRVSVYEGDTAADIYSRTEEMIRAYCRLYADIGLVLDVRRGAELSEDGGVLRTVGLYEGEVCAQARLSVSGGRAASALGADLAVALSLREALWEMEPGLSRPVQIRAGSGLMSEREDLRVLTVEMGAAGNTYAEAMRLCDPMTRAIAALIKG